MEEKERFLHKLVSKIKLWSAFQALRSNLWKKKSEINNDLYLETLNRMFIQGINLKLLRKLRELNWGSDHAKRINWATRASSDLIKSLRSATRRMLTVFFFFSFCLQGQKNNMRTLWKLPNSTIFSALISHTSDECDGTHSVTLTHNSYHKALTPNTPLPLF